MKKRKGTRKGMEMTLEQADAHQRRHGFPPLLTGAPGENKAAPVTVARGKTLCEVFVDEDKPKGKLRNVRQRKMNKTEREFSVLLDARKVRGELVEWRFEGVRLLWGGGMTYTADFSARLHSGKIEIHEVKGAHIFDRDTVRFKGCRAEWKQWFVFYFHQRTKDGQWHKLL